MSNLNIDTTTSGKMLESWLTERKLLAQTVATLKELEQDMEDVVEELDKAIETNQTLLVVIIKARREVINAHFNLMDNEQARCLSQIASLEDVLFNEKLTKDE